MAVDYGRDVVPSYGNAVKAARRGVFASEGPYTVYVLCGSNNQAAFAWDELLRMLSAGSLRVNTVKHAERWVTTEKNGKFVVRALTSGQDMAGVNPDHVIWLYEPEQATRDYITARMRGDAVQQDASL